MQLDQVLAQRQAETGALLLARDVALDLAERREGLFQVLRRHADAGVDDGKDEIAAGSQIRPDRHPAVQRRELDRIGQEVEQDLFQGTAIGIKPR